MPKPYSYDVLQELAVEIAAASVGELPFREVTSGPVQHQVSRQDMEAAAKQWIARSWNLADAFLTYGCQHFLPFFPEEKQEVEPATERKIKVKP